MEVEEDEERPVLQTLASPTPPRSPSPFRAQSPAQDSDEEEEEEEPQLQEKEELQLQEEEEADPSLRVKYESSGEDEEEEEDSNFSPVPTLPSPPSTYEGMARDVFEEPEEEEPEQENAAVFAMQRSTAQEDPATPRYEAYCNSSPAKLEASDDHVDLSIPLCSAETSG